MMLESVVVIGMVVMAGRTEAADAPSLRTDQERLSYGMGVGLARSFERQGIQLDARLLARGLEDARSGGALLMTDAELRDAMIRLQGELRERQARHARSAADARRDGEAFLAENATREGVVTLPSGLQYKVLRAGDGPKPAAADAVVCHYRGKLVDGTEFDSSYRRGRPATLQLDRVIPGWREALQLMPVGSKWQLFVPAKLAYGERGWRGRSRTAAKIGPNATLIYETELLAITPRPAGDSNAAPRTRQTHGGEPAHRDRNRG
jgi:FKBP-type peptidyl-prolyl cis-trans isomerase FklB